MMKKIYKTLYRISKNIAKVSTNQSSILFIGGEPKMPDSLLKKQK